METLDEGNLGKAPILPIQQRWNLMLVGVGLAILAQVVSIMQAMRIQDLVDRYNNGDEGAAYTFAQLGRFSPLALLASLAGIFAVVAVCLWFYRAAQNTHLAGVQFLNYTPGWHVGWFFIPFVQLVMPFITARELWKSTAVMNHPDKHGKWMDEPVSPFLNLWYISFILMMAAVVYLTFGNFSLMQRMAFDPDAMVEYFGKIPRQTYIQVPLHTIEGICLLLFAKKITDTQNQYINS